MRYLYIAEVDENGRITKCNSSEDKSLLEGHHEKLGYGFIYDNIDNQPIEYMIVDLTKETVIFEPISEEIAAENKTKLDSITKHRDKLIAQGFWFNDVKYDSRPEDQKRISGAALLAFIAISQGAQANNYLWHGGSEPFSWIAQDNSVVQMDAPTVISFGQAAAEHERAHIFAARTLKDLDPIPDDWNAPEYWPYYDASTIQDGSSIL